MVDDILNQQKILSGIPWGLHKAKAYITELILENRKVQMTVKFNPKVQWAACFGVVSQINSVK